MRNPMVSSDAQTPTAHRVCPWWMGYLLASPVRQLVHRPAEILAAHVGPGMTVLEPGPGMVSLRWNWRAWWALPAG